MRTGPVTNGASISFRTIDGTAEAALDYNPIQGKLLLPPMVKEGFIDMQLRQLDDQPKSRVFFLELLHAATPTTPVSIAIEPFPELRIAGLWPREKGVLIELKGTAHGAGYVLESSSDLKTWATDVVAQATRSTMIFETEPAPAGAARFYRAHQR